MSRGLLGCSPVSVGKTWTVGLRSHCETVTARPKRSNLSGAGEPLKVFEQERDKKCLRKINPFCSAVPDELQSGAGWETGRPSRRP